MTTIETLRNVSKVVPNSAPPPVSRTIQPLGQRLSVEVNYDEEQWVAVEAHTGMFGEGDTRTAALDDLTHGLFELRTELANHRESLAPRLRGELAAIEAYIGPAE